MPDKMSPALRSKVMSSIRGSDTRPELILRQLLWRAGLRYRVHPRLPGRPDIVFTRQRIVVFVDGCFWHGCPIHYKRPSTNEIYWDGKFRRNMDRDELVDMILICDGWTVLRFWEHEILEYASSCATEVIQYVRHVSFEST
jgi:DNA mismatch endonuclease (patch repair protein)